MVHPLLNLRKLHRAGKAAGIVSVCSSHPAVLEAAIQAAREQDRHLLVEATGNQVNQYGGYTGMTPGEFAVYVQKLAEAGGLPQNRLLLGADHIGPLVWKHEPAAAAMQKAGELAGLAAAAGFCKIHLDTAAACADEAGDSVPVKTAARRAVRLCREAEAKAPVRSGLPRPVYVIGEDVPPPGGGLAEDRSGAAPPEPPVTGPEALNDAVEQFERAFRRAGLEDAWDRVAAVVVQPGVEFGNRTAAVYRRQRAAHLSACYDQLPGRMCFEVHAADYQPQEAVVQMVEDHFCIVKIGPCLTFAYREALFSLADIEDEMPSVSRPSNLRRVMEDLMQADPGHWQGHYRGTEERLRFLRSYSLKDRIRYYWARQEARNAVRRLMENLQQPVPQPLCRQHLPDIFPGFEDRPWPSPQAVASLRIRRVLQSYHPESVETRL